MINALDLKGPVYDPGGYAEVTRSLALAFHRLGVKVHLQRHPWDFVRTNLPENWQKALAEMMATPPGAGPFLQIGVPDDFRRDPLRFSIGLTMLETDRICADWVRKCNEMDEIWVPSTFNWHTFTASGVDPAKIKVMPLGVDAARFRPEAAPLPIPGKRGFTFLANFEWNLRKGYDLLLLAFAQEFDPREEVCLVLKTLQNGPSFDPNGSSIRYEIEQFLHHLGKKATAPIILIPQVLAVGQMPSLYTAADCYVLPTRGEGWNLTILEAMASALPVITTKWSAPLDYLTPANSFLIPSTGLEPVPAIDRWRDKIYAGSCWAKPSLPATRRLMRLVFTNPALARERGRRARADVLSRFTWEAAAARMLRRLEEIGCGPRQLENE